MQVDDSGDVADGHPIVEQSPIAMKNIAGDETVRIVLDREAQQPYDGIGAAVHRSGWTQQVSE